MEAAIATIDPCEISPLEKAVALDAEFYTDPQWLEFEQREIFSRNWSLVGNVEDVANPGDHIAAEVAGKPVLVVRGTDGALNAFYNVCRHRAGPLATCNGRAAKRFRCAYHGWTYELDGRLRAAPEMSNADGFDPAQQSLILVKTDVWENLVFVRLAGEEPPLAKLMEGLAARITPINLAAMKFERREIYRVNANWKTYIDNYLEGYHVPSVHPVLNTMVDYAGYTTGLEKWNSVQASSLSNSADIYGDGPTFYCFFHPNTMLNIVSERMQTNRVIPDGPNACIIEFDYYYSDAPGARERAQADRVFSGEVQEEDRIICEQVQKGLASGSYQAGRLCPDREQAVWHSHNLLRNAYAAAFKDEA